MFNRRHGGTPARPGGPSLGKPEPAAPARQPEPTRSAPVRSEPARLKPLEPLAQRLAMERPTAPIASQPAPRSAPPPLPHPAPAAAHSVGRVMLVGPDIRLSGEIRSCERLVVEGSVEGEVSDTERLEILRGGRFHGTAEVESCVVDGVFEGELSVRGVLALKSGGRVSGTVRYGEIEIERGGTIAGTVGAPGTPAKRPVQAAGPRPA